MTYCSVAHSTKESSHSILALIPKDTNILKLLHLEQIMISNLAKVTQIFVLQNCGLELTGKDFEESPA